MYMCVCVHVFKMCMLCVCVCVSVFLRYACCVIVCVMCLRCIMCRVSYIKMFTNQISLQLFPTVAMEYLSFCAKVYYLTGLQRFPIWSVKINRGVSPLATTNGNVCLVLCWHGSCLLYIAYCQCFLFCIVGFLFVFPRTYCFVCIVYI